MPLQRSVRPNGRSAPQLLAIVLPEARAASPLKSGAMDFDLGAAMLVIVAAMQETKHGRGGG